MRKFLALLLCAAMLVGLASCAAEQEEVRLHASVRSVPSSLDPTAAEGDGSQIIAANCFEGLVCFNARGALDLAGAVSYAVSPDALTYTFELNPEARWYVSDETQRLLTAAGETAFDPAVTAADYVYGFKRLTEAEDTTLAGVTATAEGALTLRLTLTEPDPDLLYKLAALPLLPCSERFVKAMGERCGRFPDTTLFNGPYVVGDVKEGRELTLTPNPDYRGRLSVRNAAVTLTLAESAEEAAKRFKKGVDDVYLTTSFARADTANPQAELAAVWGLCFNQSKWELQNADLRRAVVTSFNLDTVKLPAFSSGRAENVIPPAYFFMADRYTVCMPPAVTRTFDSAAASLLLDKALRELGIARQRLTLYVPDKLADSFRALIDYQATFLGDRLAVDLKTFDASDPAAIEAVEQAEDYWMAVLPLHADLKTARSLLQGLSGAPCFYESENLEKTVKAFSDKRSAVNAARYLELAEKEIAEDAVFTPLFYSTDILYCAHGVSGIYTADGNRLTYFCGGTRDAHPGPAPTAAPTEPETEETT